MSIEALHQQLRAAIDVIETGDQWRAWLDFSRQLHPYSFNNLVLIWSQRPDATAVASYRTWQAAHRQVRRGEKALRVMAPILRRAVVLDDDGHIVRGPDGRQQLRQQVVGFRPVPVFDVSQTDGPPLPQPATPVLLSGQAPARLWERLAEEVAERGYRLLRGGQEQLGEANGATRVREREVWVRDDVDPAQAAKTLAHELAHVMLHSDIGKGVVPCAGVREVEAESVAHLVLGAHGLDTGTYTFPYVATWAYPLAAVEHVPMADIVSRSGTRVVETARQIITSTTEATPTASATTGALNVRVSHAAQQAADLRERTPVAALPAVDRDVLLGVVADSQDYFRRRVDRSWVPDYVQERGMATALRSHQLGYAPAGWTVLTDHLRGLGYTDDHIEAAGVATRTRKGHLIDRFRDRLTVPLHHPGGELVAFSARVNPRHEGSRDEPKYLNSSATTLFNKSEVLYGLAEHRELIKNGHLPVLCEGPFDAISVDLLAARRGTPAAGVAVIGTAFTPRHAHHLLDATGGRPICLAFDGDAAGATAAHKAWLTLTENAPRDVRMAVLPAGSDPASLFRDDPDALAGSIVGAGSAAWCITDRQLAGVELDGNGLREVAAFRQLAAFAERVPTGQRAEYLLRLAERLHIKPTDAAAEIAARYPTMFTDAAALQTMVNCQRLAIALPDKTEGQDAVSTYRCNPPALHPAASLTR